MAGSRVTAWLLPLAVAAFVATAVASLRGLPESVPLRLAADGSVERALPAKTFQALVWGLVLLLTTLFGLARWILLQPQYDPQGDFRRYPLLRDRMLRVLDGLGAGGVALVTWTTWRCASASHAGSPPPSRLELLVPFVLLLLLGAAGYLWLRQARRP